MIIIIKAWKTVLVVHSLQSLLRKADQEYHNQKSCNVNNYRKQLYNYLNRLDGEKNNHASLIAFGGLGQMRRLARSGPQAVVW